MEEFTCPRCSQPSSYDPLAGSAQCPQCGYAPPMDIRVPADFAGEPWPHDPGNGESATQSGRPAEIRMPLLDELLSYWGGTYAPELGGRWPTRKEAYALFGAYQHALGEQPKQGSGQSLRYVRSYKPEKKAILLFVAGYLQLRYGNRTRAAEQLLDLTWLAPKFPDPWIWLSATTGDSAQRIDYLENAVLLEPTHPLARDALAIAQGKVSPAKKRQGLEEKPRVILSKCPRCGGTFHYEPGAIVVVCQYCEYRLQLEQDNIVDGEATLIGDLQLKRRLQGQAWREVQRLVHCQTCGAQLTMTRFLAKQCVFCCSTSVLAEDSRGTFEQPDGFLPFKLGEKQAATVIGGAQRSTSHRLKAWWTGQEEEIIAMQAVYLPFWLFDGFVEVRGTEVGRPDHGAKIDSSTLGASSLAVVMGMLDQDPAHGESVAGRELIMFDNLLYSAMDFPPPWLLKQILPFELSAVVPYEARLLANWPAALYHRDVEVVVREAYNHMLAKAVWRKRSLAMAQVSDIEDLRRTFQVTTVTYQLILLPVWVAMAQRAHERRLALINGQTGQVTFSSPIRSKT